MILYPDQRVTQQPDNETCVFAAPIERVEWEHLYERGRKNTLKHTDMRYVLFRDDDGQTTSVYFMRNDAEVTDEACILLRGAMDDADKCLESAAWIRINENFPGMIYMTGYRTDACKWQTMNAALGTPQELVCMVDYDLDLQTGEDS